MTLQKYINLYLTASNNLRRYKAKSLAVIIPLTLAMSVCSFMMFSKSGFIKDAQIAHDFLPDITVQGMEAGRVAKISMDMKPEIEKIAHVKKVLPRVWGYIPLNIDGTDIAYTLMGLDLEHLPKNTKLFEALYDGYFLVPGDQNKAVIGYGVAQSFGFKVGDKIKFDIELGVDLGFEVKDIGDKIKIEDTLGNNGEFEIVGIFNNNVQVYSADLILVSNEDARAFFGYKVSEASDLLVYLDDPAHADKVAFTINQRFKNTRVLTGKALTNLVKEAFGRRAGTFQAMWLILLTTVLLLSWAKFSHISVDISRETGILKAVGWKTGEIITVKMIESLLSGLIGTVLGILLGFIYALMGTPGISGYCIGCASVYPKFPVPVSCDFGSIALIFLLGTLPITLVSAIPAWLTATIDPDDAIRS
jgi:ABC-type lipoprotein release transport system permease subunit